MPARVKGAVIDKRPEEISAIILKKIIKDSEEFLGKKIDSAVITIPAFFTDAQKIATKNAAKIANIKVIRLINEPTAAVLAYAQSEPLDGQIVLIFDFGGGTFDVTIAKIIVGKVEVLSTHGDRKRGGKDIDDKLLHYCAEEISSALFGIAVIFPLTQKIRPLYVCVRLRVIFNKFVAILLQY